jgi:hypothetical protein
VITVIRRGAAVNWAGRKIRAMRAWIAGVVALGVLVAASEAAGDIGRAEFVKRADNICQPQRNDAKRLIANGIRLLTKKHPRIQAAGREFVRAYRELRIGYNRVGRLPRPRHGDRVRITKWLRRERAATATGVRAAKALRRHRFERSERLNRKAQRLEQRARRPVRNFDFEHCKPI